MELKEKIENLKAASNAAILAHYYEDGEIQEVSDFVGDSLYLAQLGENLANPVIVLNGVYFMAESVKILSPTKKVLIPDSSAGCSLVDASPAPAYRKWREQNPDAIAVTYVNSSADVKAISDVICTSSNAEKIIAAIPPEREILFGPDRNLGRYLAQKLKRKMQMWPGACEVHILFSAKRLHALKLDRPEAVILAHPECSDDILVHADVIGSTSRLLQEVEKNPARTFVVATEDGIFHQMKKARPDVELIQAPSHGTCACNQCPHMKLINMQKLADCLENETPEILLPDNLIEKARISLNRMMRITRGEAVEWPKTFQD